MGFCHPIPIPRMHAGVFSHRGFFLTLFSFQAFGDAAINKEISELRVHCVTLGCSWSGIMKDFEVCLKRVYSD